MKALSIRPHWAWAIMHAGKDIENRSWKTNFRGVVAIHTSGNSNRREYEWAVKYMKKVAPRAKVPPFEQLVRGAILGVVDVVGCEKRTKSKWHFRGNWGFVLKNPRSLRRPIPCPGRLNFWEVPNGVAQRIQRSVRTR